MNEVLYDAVRHNNWASKQLVVFCRDQNLTPEQLLATGVGTFGTILQTLHHIVTCDGSYLRRLADVDAGTDADPDRLAWAKDGPTEADFDTLELWIEEASLSWEDLLTKPIDTERVVVIDNGLRECHAGIFIAQALNHANHHREQVCAILTGLGIEPPDIQAWEYAWHTHRIWDR